MVTAGVRNLILLLALLAATPGQARESAECALPTTPLTVLEAELLGDMVDGQLQQFTLLEAALIASRVDQRPRLEQCLARFAEVARLLKAERRGEQTPEQQADLVLQFLHQRVLTGSYLPACTAVDRSLETGDYNCVTATILYRCLSAVCELPVITLAQPGHVYCRLASSDLAIQTTSPHGLLARPAPAWPASEPTSGRAGRAAEGAAERSGRPLTDVQLVAKIYYNRGVNLLAGDAFASALPLLELACQLDLQDRIARSNVLACLNNWALAECQAGRYQAALRLLAEGMRLEPDYPAFADNDVYIHGCWVRQLCREGRYAEALELLRAAHQRRPSVELFRRGQGLVYEAWRQAPAAAGLPPEPDGKDLQPLPPESPPPGELDGLGRAG